MTPSPRVTRRLPALFAAALLAFVPAALHAQAATDWCGNISRNQHCEIRQLNSAMTGSELVIDIGANGSVQVDGYDGRDVRVTARVVTRGGSASQARELAQEVDVRLATGTLRASGPRSLGQTGWSVSVRVQVPRGVAIDAKTTNGGVTIAGTHAPVVVHTTNGSVRLTDAVGSIDVRSTNGTIRAAFAPGGAIAEDMQLRTTNGSIHLTLPENASARLQFSTTNGSINTQLPIQVQGRIDRRRMTGVLGNGGFEIRASTTNGSIHLNRH
jgi:hypothetical protein